MTVAALSGCVSKLENLNKKIITYTDEPDNLIPGIPNYYATAMKLMEM